MHSALLSFGVDALYKLMFSLLTPTYLFSISARLFLITTGYLSGSVVMVRLSNSAHALMLEMPQGDKLHNFLAELKRTTQSTFPVWNNPFYDVQWLSE